MQYKDVMFNKGVIKNKNENGIEGEEEEETQKTVTGMN